VCQVPPLVDPNSTSSAHGDVTRGRTVPRLWTPPLVAGAPGPCGCGCALTEATSFGFQFADFCERIGYPLDEWQRWLAIHLGELLPNGMPRFRIVLVLVARQNGKSTFAMLLSLWWLFVDLPGTGDDPTVLTISSKVDYAKELWMKGVNIARSIPMLADEIPKNGVRESNGEQTLTTTHGTRHKIAASNDDAGRSLTVARLVMDELRRQHDFTAWSAAEPTTSSIPDAQIICLSNQGDDRSVVLDSHRKAALEFIETGQGDETLAIFEWSSPDGSDPTDAEALAQANPNLNHPDGRNPLKALLGNAIRAKAAGGEELAKFRTESMCQRVHLLDPAIDPGKWALCGTDTPTPLSTHRDRVALCVDVSLDGRHAVLIGAAEVGGIVHVEVIQQWTGDSATRDLRRDLPALVAKVRPKVLGWFPSGPATRVAADLSDPKRRGGRRVAWPPRGVKVEEIRADLASVCMGFADLVESEEVSHPNDPMLDQHVWSAQKLLRGDAWVYRRKDTGPIDGAYAAAGAVHLARLLPPARPPIRLLTAEKTST
jgi:hypothetical protein